MLLKKTTKSVDFSAQPQQQATSNKQQATSNKQQATSNKQQATSNKQQATSNYRVAFLFVKYVATNPSFFVSLFLLKYDTAADIFLPHTVAGSIPVSELGNPNVELGKSTAKGNPFDLFVLPNDLKGIRAHTQSFAVQIENESKKGPWGPLR